MLRGLVLAAAIVGLIAAGLVGGQQSAQAQQTASATRSFSPSPPEVEPDGPLVVTISVADYGGIGQLREAFPADFTFVRSSPEATRSGQTLTFNLVGDTSVSYTLRAPTTTGKKSGFSGTLEPAEGDGVTVVGPSSVTVSSPPAQQTASATRSFSPSRPEVEPDAPLVVTISVADYGGIGQLREAFPADFTFVRSSPEGTRSGQTLTFNLVGDTSVSYTLRAPTTTGEKSGFSGTLEPAEGDGVTVDGPSSVTVSSPPAQQTASATRSFSPSRPEVEPDAPLVVTISVADYGGIGQLREAFPADFTFVRSSPEATRSGQTLTFNLVGDTSVSYTLRAPTTTGEKSGFSGTLEPAEGDGVTVVGPSSVTVLGPRATRSFSSTTVRPSGQVTVTITARDYGSLGAVVETLPNGFAYGSSGSSTLAYVEEYRAYVEEHEMELTFLRFALLDPNNTSFMYTVSAPRWPGSYDFMGQLIDDAEMSHDVGGGPITVMSPPAVQPPAVQPPPPPRRRGGGGGGGGAGRGGGYAPPVAKATPTPIVVPTIIAPTATPTLEPTMPPPTEMPTPRPKPTEEVVMIPTVAPTPVPAAVPTEPPAPTATTAPTVVPVTPVTPEAGGMPGWVIIVIIVAVVIAAVGFYLMRMRR